MVKLRPLSEPRSRCSEVRTHLPRKKQVVKSFYHDGLVDSFVTVEEFKDFGDEHQNYREYSLQSIINAEAVQLLQPCPVVSLSTLAAADHIGSISGSITQLDTLAKSLTSQQSENSTVVESTKTE